MHPFKNAALAALYIILIVFAIRAIAPFDGGKESVLIPMIMLSLLVLWVAFVGFFFASEPLRLYFESQKKEALLFLIKTIGFFACFVIAFIAVLLLSAPR